MSSRLEAVRNVSDFVQLLRKFLTAYTQLTTVLGDTDGDQLSFAALRELVGDDDGSVLYRLKEKSHALFRSDALATEAVREHAGPRVILAHARNVGHSGSTEELARLCQLLTDRLASPAAWALTQGEHPLRVEVKVFLERVGRAR